MDHQPSLFLPTIQALLPLEKKHQEDAVNCASSAIAMGASWKAIETLGN
jgi:hypothetical protein